MSGVDVVIPCYKYGHFLSGCVQSALNQRDVTVRILIIDDCSPDETETVGRNLAASDSRVEYRKHGINRGHIATYNEGLLEWATSDYVVLLSADDALLPGALSRAAGLMDANPDVAFAFGRSIQIRDGRPMRTPEDLPTSVRVLGGDEWIDEMCRRGHNPIASPEVVVRRTVQQLAGGYRSDLPHTGDLEMWLRLATYGRVGIIDGDQAFYRIHDSNMHQQIADTRYKDLQHLFAAFKALLDSGRLDPQRSLTLEAALRKDFAKHSLDAAWDAFEASDTRASRELVRYAMQVCPECQSWKEYSRLQWKLRLGTPATALIRRLKSCMPTRAICR